jgi:hypothetical protein
MACHDFASRTVLWCSLAAGGMMLAPTTGFAQDALGDGRALDSNLQVGGGYNTVRPDQRQIYQYRNAMLTGNVPIRSFRGNLGYTAPNDFRGELGSDEIFRFERDSYYSGLALQGFRSVEVVREAIQVANPNNFSRFSVSRMGSGVSLADVRVRQGDQMYLPVGGVPVNDVSQTTRFLRSLSERDAVGASMGSVVGYGQNARGGTIEIAASPLRGLFAEEILTAEEAAAAAGGSRAPSNQFEPTRLENGVDPYVDLLDRFSQTGAEQEPGEDEATGAAGEEPAETESVQDRLNRLMTFEEQLRQFTDVIQKREAEAEAAEAAAETEDEGTNDEGDLRMTPEGPSVGPLSRLEQQRERIRNLTREMLRERVRYDRPIVTDLAGTMDDLFNRQMRRAETLLADGRYFDAEAQFSGALEFRPNHPLAEIGMLNAQVGAGLFISAGSTLRRVAAAHPEVLVANYADHLMPSGERRADVLRILEQRLDEKSSFASTAALLVAYLGHLDQDPELVGRGLDALERQGDPDELHALLSGLWLDPVEDDGEDR